MDIFTSEQVHLERHRERVAAAERRARLMPPGRPASVRLWVAGRLRAAADRIDGRPQLSRVA